MLHITNIRLLSKVQGIFDNIDTPEFILKVAVDEAFFFPEVIGKTDKYQSTWGQTAFPLLQLSQTGNDYKLSFIVYRNGVMIGIAKTKIAYGQNLKEQNEVVSNNNTVAAKILYQCEWYNSPPPGLAHITNEQFLAQKYNNAQGGVKPVVPAQTTTTQKQKKYVRQAGDEECGGLCGCFGTRKKKKEKEPAPEPRTPPPELLETTAFGNEKKTGEHAKFVASSSQVNRKPFIYSQSQLSAAKMENSNLLSNGEPKRLCYFSKSYFLSR